MPARPTDPVEPAPRRVQIPVAHGHLEGLLVAPETPRAAAVMCHPHPLFGGTMNNNVVYRAARALSAAGLAVLRFNFRGVGGSTGTHGGGVPEEDDALAALDFLNAACPGAPLWMGGFSFGARVGLSLGMREPRVTRLLGIGLAARLFDYSFLATCTKPKAIVQAARDEYCDEAAVRTLVAGFAEPKRLDVVPDATHLFPGKLDELEAACARGVAWLLGEGAG